MNYDGMPHSSVPGEPTALAAERAAELSKDCELIEQAAIAADAGIYQWLLLSVTQDVSWRYLKMLKELKTRENTFIKIRRRFYCILAKKKVMV